MEPYVIGVAICAAALGLLVGAGLGCLMADYRLVRRNAELEDQLEALAQELDYTHRLYVDEVKARNNAQTANEFLTELLFPMGDAA